MPRLSLACLSDAANIGERKQNYLIEAVNSSGRPRRAFNIMTLMSAASEVSPGLLMRLIDMLHTSSQGL
jgi:hypothetical protein